MIASDAIRALLLATIPVALWLGHPSFFQIAAVAFLDGCLFTVSYVAERGALPHVVEIRPAPGRRDPKPGTAVRREHRRPAVGRPALRRRSRASVRRGCLFFRGLDGDGRGHTSELSVPIAYSSPGAVGWLCGGPEMAVGTAVFPVGRVAVCGRQPALHGALSPGDPARQAPRGLLRRGRGDVCVGGSRRPARRASASPVRRRISARAALVGEAWLVGCAMPLLLIAHAAALIGLIVAVAEFPTPLTKFVRIRLPRRSDP